MDRDIALIRYLPDYLKQVEEMQMIMKVQEAEVKEIWKELGKSLDNQFIVSAGRAGLKRFEEILGLQSLDDDPLEIRRFRVMSKWNRYIPYTMKTLDKKLKVLCGEDGYMLRLNAGDRTLLVRVNLEKRRCFEDVRQMLEEMTPCNIVIDLSLLYNQHQYFFHMTNRRMGRYTHYDLRNRVFRMNNHAVIKGSTNRELAAHRHKEVMEGEL